MVLDHWTGFLMIAVALSLVCFFARAESVPLEQIAWLSLKFNKIRANQVTFSENKIGIEVKQSGGPIVHKLTRTISVSGFRVRGHLSGVKAVESGPFDEDSILRFGLVVEGKQTLSGPRRWIAADWVKKLFELAPAKTGIDKIHFFSITNRPDLIGKYRLHPKSDLITETIVSSLTKEGDFDFTYQFKEPIRVVGLWLSVDGDDSKSNFSTILTSIELNP